jgi:hypothetical protein
MAAMQRLAVRSALIPLILTVGGPVAIARQPQLWQADIQIRILEVTQTKTSMSARVVVYTEHDDDAMDAHLLVLLPVGVGIERLGPGCAASPAPSQVPSLRATVQCDLGVIPNRGFREVVLTTTLPPDALPKRFGVFTYSATPDPVPGNNYAERTMP